MKPQRAWTRLATLLFALLAVRAGAGDFVASEVVRLQDEMSDRARKNAWVGVERSYQQILALGAVPDREHLLLAAEAARLQGDVLSSLQRMLEAQSLENSEELATRIGDVGATFGRVQLVGQAPVVIERQPFRPDAAAAVRYADTEAQSTGTFDGFLPEGSYRFGDVAFHVTPGPELVVLSLDPSRPPTEDITLSGVSFPRNAFLGGRMLRLNGVGVRSKLGIQVYMAALYLARPTAVGSEAIQEDLPKRLVQLFVFRQVSRQAVVDHLRQAFARQHLSDRVQDDIETFLSVVEDVEAGDRMVYDYVPGRGTSILIDGKRKALVAGQPFMEALFGVFIGADPPTRKLKRGLLGDTAP